MRNFNLTWNQLQHFEIHNFITTPSRLAEHYFTDDSFAACATSFCQMRPMISIQLGTNCNIWKWKFYHDSLNIISLMIHLQLIQKLVCQRLHHAFHHLDLGWNQLQHFKIKDFRLFSPHCLPEAVSWCSTPAKHVRLSTVAIEDIYVSSILIRGCS